jgi:hypothetical protein
MVICESLLWSLVGVCRGSCFSLLSLLSVFCSFRGGRLRRAGGWRPGGPWRSVRRCGRSVRCLLLLSSPAVRRSVGPPSCGAPGRVARFGVGSRVRARLRPRLAVGFPCSPFLLVASLGGAPWSLRLLPSLPAPPLSSLSRAGRCPPSSFALVGLAPLGCWSPASGRWRRPPPSPAARLSGRAARWRSALVQVAPPARGRCRARWRGPPPAARLARVACCRSRAGCAVCPLRWAAPVCPVCNSIVRCPACPPSSPAGAPVPLVRCAPVARWFAPCPLCGALGLVLSTSGAARPFVWCAWCGVASPAPARPRWSSSPVPAAVQPSLF